MTTSKPRKPSASRPAPSSSSPRPRRPASPANPASAPAAPRKPGGPAHPGKAASTAGAPSSVQRARPDEPLSEQDMERLQELLDAVPAPLEPLDISMLDGYLVGVLLQPRPVP
ncbi:MAG TPA: UPF0149 family protein, partial [Burkholderiaceae bacterium]|nr:UPF0149 family protein [Burkholderiaceae bacterium]